MEGLAWSDTDDFLEGGGQLSEDAPFRFRSKFHKGSFFRGSVETVGGGFHDEPSKDFPEAGGGVEIRFAGAADPVPVGLGIVPQVRLIEGGLDKGRERNEPRIRVGLTKQSGPHGMREGVH